VTLEDVTMQNEYEGDAMTRNILIYTLNFSLKIGLYGGLYDGKQIKQVFVAFNNDENEEFISGYSAQVDPTDATDEEEYTVREMIQLIDSRTTVSMVIDNLTGDPAEGDVVVGESSGSSATVSAYDANSDTITLSWPDGPFDVGEIVSSEFISFEVVTVEYTDE
jgi:hypothetical protein